MNDEYASVRLELWDAIEAYAELRALQAQHRAQLGCSNLEPERFADAEHRIAEAIAKTISAGVAQGVAAIQDAMRVR